MKKTSIKIITILIILTIVGELFAGAAFPYPPTAKSVDGNVVIEWHTQSETNLDYYAIERKTQNMSGFVRLPDRIYPNSNHFYRFVDKSAYKTSDNVYVYKVAIVDKDGSVTYSSEFSVLHNNVSGVKRTWGSIKALFR